MSYEIILSLAVFVFVTTATPGPNNIMLLTSGVNYGFVKSIPHILGILFGFSFMTICFAVGLGRLFQLYPEILVYLKVVRLPLPGMAQLAHRLQQKQSQKSQTAKKSRPLTLIEAALFQWVNPKALVMGLSIVTLFLVPEQLLLSVILVPTTVMSVQIFCLSAWAGFGVALRVFLSDPKRLRIFNICMGVLLILSIVPIVFV